MNQRQVLINRVLNQIQNTKRQLSQQQMPLYNDLLIVSFIVPQVSKKILRKMLEELKPHQSNQQAKNFSIVKIAQILKQVQNKSNLLQDFLECTGYSLNSVPLNY